MDDQQRVNKISEEQLRIEKEAQAREEILRRSDEERQLRDKARREEDSLNMYRSVRALKLDLSANIPLMQCQCIDLLLPELFVTCGYIIGSVILII